MKKKIFFSVIFVALYWLFAVTIGDAVEAAKTPLIGSLATAQFQDSTVAYIKQHVGVNIMKSLDLNLVAFVLLLGSLATLWYADIKKAITAAAIAVLVISMVPTDSFAYYAKTDYTEVVEILPNQTAFLIPETGENKSGQAAFMSVDYLNTNKVAMKRVTIPHVKLTGTSVWADYFVPAARLLIVDRTPVSREWVTSASRGTANADQGFRFESKESINIETGIVISAFVKEEDAAKFVYWFGSHQQKASADQTDEDKFASVINGRSLAEVVDDNVRRKVQAVLAREFGKYSLTDAAAHKADVIAIVDKEVKDTFAPMGITVSYVGYAEGLTYNAEIQKAIDNVFLAEKKADAAQQLMASVPYEQAMVNINYINAQADAIRSAGKQWNGQLNLPSWVIIPQGVLDSVNSWLAHTTKPVTAVKGE